MNSENHKSFIVRGVLSAEALIRDNSDYIYYFTMTAAVWSIFSLYLYTRRAYSQLQVGEIMESLKQERTRKSKLEASINRTEFILDTVLMLNKRTFWLNVVVLVVLAIEGWFDMVCSPETRQFIFRLSFLGKYALALIGIFMIGSLARIQIQKRFKWLLNKKSECDSHAEILLDTLIMEFGPEISGELTSYIKEALQVKNERLRSANQKLSAIMYSKQDKQSKVQDALNFYEGIIDKLLAYDWHVSLRGVHKPLSKSHVFNNIERPGTNTLIRQKSTEDISKMSVDKAGIVIDRQYSTNLKRYFDFLEAIGQSVKKRCDNSDISIDDVIEDLDEEIADEVIGEVQKDCRYSYLDEDIPEVGPRGIPNRAQSEGHALNGKGLPLSDEDNGDVTDRIQRKCSSDFGDAGDKYEVLKSPTGPLMDKLELNLPKSNQKQAGSTPKKALSHRITIPRESTTFEEDVKNRKPISPIKVCSKTEHAPDL